MKEWNLFGDDTASDLDAGVAGRLCRKVIGRTVNDQGASDDLRQFHPIGIDDTVGISFIAQKRRQIAGMFRMRQALRIIMTSRFVKGKRAVPRLMDVQTIELSVRRYLLIREIKNFRLDQYASGRNRIKISSSLEGRVIGIAADFSVSARM